MAKTLNYYGTTNFQEQPVTGRLVTWITGSKETVSDSVAALLLASGGKFQVETDLSGEYVTMSTDSSGNFNGLIDPKISGRIVRTNLDYYTQKTDFVVTDGFTPFTLPSTTPPAPTGATGTATLDSTITWKSGNTWKIVNQTVGGNIAVSYNLPTPLAATLTAPTMYIPVYVPDYKSLNDIAVYLSMGDTTYANMFQFVSYGIGPAGNTDKQRNGWHFIAISPSMWATGAGTPAWTQTINSIRFRFFKNATGGNDGIIYVGQPLFCYQTKPVLMLYADDVHRSFYNNGLRIADSLGLKFSLAAAVGWINNATYFSQDMYLDAQARGHEICVHSLNQIGVNVTDFASATADIALNQAYVRDVIKAPFGYKHFVWPNGRYWVNGSDRADMSVVDYCKNTLGMVIGRTTDDAARNTVKTTAGWSSEPQKYNQMLIPELFPNNASKTLAQLQTAVQELIEKRGIGSFVVHGLAFDGTTDPEKPHIFHAMLEYIAAMEKSGAIICPTGEELYRYIS